MTSGAPRRGSPAMSEPRRRTHVALETTEPTSFGSGFISGLLAAILGIAGFGLALSLRFPQYFGYERLAPLHGLAYLRAAIHVTLIASFLLGTLSAFLRANKALALTGLGFTLAAALIGGSQVPVGAEGPGAWLGVDFFVLNLVLYSAVFVPMERLFALRAQQPVFRRLWLLDLTYFFLNSLLVEVLTLLHLASGADPFRLGTDRGRADNRGGNAAAVRSGGAPARGGFHAGTGCTAGFTASGGSGDSTPSTIRWRTWTGWPARGYTSWM